MSSDTDRLAMPVEMAERIPRAEPLKGWRRWLTPSLTDCLFICLVFWLFMTAGAGWSILLADGDAGWHIRVGESILDTGVIPQTDPFSFTKPGAPWYAWEWLAEAGMAHLHRLGGLKGVTLFAGIIVAMFGALSLRLLLWKGANVWIALGVTLLMMGAASVHFLARPHLVTFIFLLASLWLVERDRRQPGRLVWLLVPLTVLWTNLHGGFLALFVCLGGVVVGSIIEGVWRRDELPEKLRLAAKYAALGVACATASILNPFGIELHRHILAYLQSDWIKRVVNEFQSPSFRAENILQYEVLLLLGVVAAGWLLQRGRVVEAIWILAWAHFSLSGARHIPIYAIFAGPPVAVELTGIWNRWREGKKKSSLVGILDQLSRDLTPGFRRFSVWPLVFIAFLVFERGQLQWPADFPEQKFPLAMIHRHAEEIRSARIFTEDEWADYLLYLNFPEQRVFMDGRTDFYGPEVGDKYLATLYGKPEWAGVLREYSVELVLVPPEKPLASLLAAHETWERVDGDDKAVLFRYAGGEGREGAGRIAVSRVLGLQKSPADTNETVPRSRKY